MPTENEKLNVFLCAQVVGYVKATERIVMFLD